VFMQFQEGGGLLFGIGGVLGGERQGSGAGDWRLATRDWHRSRVCHKKTSEAVLAWAEGDSMGRVVDVVGWEGQMDKGAA
jgi:hypothetical protein